MRRRVVGFGLVITTATGLVASAGMTGASAAASASQIVLAPNHRIDAKPGGGGGGGGVPAWPGWASSNWSGYAVTNGDYKSVSGQWTVPTVPAKGSGFSAAWIGIGGFNTADLIQTGTEQDSVNGKAQYAAWWTTSDLGYAEQVIPGFVVNPGDVINASVVKSKRGSTWTMTLSDGSQSFSKSVQFTSSESSAEWIMEAPGLGPKRIAPIANYGADVFDPGTVNGTASPAFTAADGGILIQKNVVVSIPSAPDSDADGFAIAYGSQQPQPPGS